ncbi:serine/threonine-protein kinase ATR-like isoform X2 [Dreissena polymorpha]|uniref:serine/threonine-protein kinase ATR-like isoform X2 n=1 Tax=Dreissena polymorpha TaxID=45954 RepID=UPI0022656A67|nr:serine/threonine-protein kinase ATR-like isoform X2 [Dreissena polymorpha]
MLAESVAFVNKFQGGADEEHNIFECRLFLGRLVQDYLTDFHKFSQMLEKSSNSIECHMPLKCCALLLRHCSEVFLPAPVTHSADTPPLDRGPTNDEDTTYGFLWWYVSRITVLLGQFNCKEIHELTRDTIVQLLQAVKARDSYEYSRLLRELVIFVADLVQINEQMVEMQIESAIVHRFQVNMDQVCRSLFEQHHRQSPCAVTLTRADFSLSDQETCEQMLINLLRVLMRVAGDVCGFCLESQVMALAAGACCLLEIGEIDMKMESLQLLAVLVRDCRLMMKDSELCDYLLDTVLSVVQLLCTGLPRVHDLSDSDWCEFERCTGHFLVVLVEQCSCECYGLESTALSEVLVRLGDILGLEGMGRLRTDYLQAALHRLVGLILDKLSLDYQRSLTCRPHIRRLVSALITQIGCSTNLQYVVSPLVKVILSELSTLLPTAETTTAVTTGTGNNTPKPGNKHSKRKLDESSVPVPKLNKMSMTYQELHSKLEDLLQQPLQGSVSRKAEGVQIIMELITSCVQLVPKSNARFFKELGKLSSWLSNENLQQIFGFLFRALQHLTESSTADEMNMVYLSVLKTVGALLAVQDSADLENDLYQSLGWIASLPWLLNDPSWIDLKPTNTRDIVKISCIVVPKLGVESSSECLLVLALLPKEVVHKWRVHVFRQAMCESEPCIKRAAILAFPLLLFNLGPNANHLVYDLLHPSVQEKDVSVHAVLACVAGPLACVVSRKALVHRDCHVSGSLPLYKRIRVECLSCDSCALSDVTASPRERPRLVDANMFLPFLQLVSSEEAHIRLALVGSMRRMFGHVGVRKNNPASINIFNQALGLMEDDNYDNRVTFSKVIEHLLKEQTCEDVDNANKLILTKLREAFIRAKADGNTRVQETLLLTIAQLGRVSEGDVLVVVIINLLESMLSPQPQVAAVAYMQLKDIADHKKTKTQNLFMRCRRDVCKFLVDAMHDAQSGSMGKSGEEILSEVASVLGFQNIKAFLSGTEKFVVPYLVSKRSVAASNLIKMVATQLEVASRSKLLINNTKYVFSYLVRTKPDMTDLQTAIQYLQKETGFDLPNLLRINFQQVHNELLLHLSTSYSQVFNGLKMLSMNDEDFKSGPISTSEEMAAYLQPRILGVLAHFDSQLLNSSLPMEEKRPVLDSLISIMRLMGSKIISGIRHKVMSTLRIGLEINDSVFKEISCRAWNCFVRSLELPFLGQMLPQIVATLLPLLQELPKHVATIIHYMIVENRASLKDHFNDVYFLPDIPELADANSILKNHTDVLSSQLDFRSHVNHSLRGIQHESLDVRLHALSKLKSMLKEKQLSFAQLVMENETADSLVSKLISVLLKGCREPDIRAQRLYAECLGLCGAIDPGRLELAANNQEAERANFQYSIHKDTFAVALINEVVKSYLAATEPRIQDCSALALQDLLSIYTISDTSTDERINKLWSQFSSHVKEILLPFMSTKYILAPTQNNWSNLQKPIYGSKKGNSFKDWVSTWTGYLSSKVLEESKAHRVFKACSAVIKFDLHIALYILPYVVFHVLQDGSSQDIDEAVGEIIEVLTQVTCMDSKNKGDNLHHMSAQTIFSVLDYLTKWKYLSLQIGTAEPNSKEWRGRVEEFLYKIPQDKLAQASFRCKAYTRALMHHELHIRDKAQLSKEELDFMQRLYVELDEPDGVQGVAAIRMSAPSLQEQILTYTGRQGCQIELQVCYEQALQAEPDELSHHQGLLRCFMDLSQPSLALQHASGVISNRVLKDDCKAWSLQLLPFQVEASWKLGNWADLHNYNMKDLSSRSWSVMLGRILLAARAKKEDEFLQHLQIARQEQVGPLSAASMEMGSYQRGYEHIVRLHQLSEIEESVRVLLGFPGNGAQDDVGFRGEHLLAHWRMRVKMMQSSFRIQEPVLTMRRTLMSLSQEQGRDLHLDLEKEIGHSWLDSAKTAQKTGHLQSAARFLLQASEFGLPEFCLHKAKWHWEKDEHEQALSLLEQQMTVHFPNIALIKADNSEAGKATRRVYAKALLLYGRYSEETSRMESNAIVKQYKEVIDIAPDWEQGYFYLGKYFDKIMTSVLDDKDSMDKVKQGEFLLHVVKNLGTSLRYGNTFIYQSLPRLLSLWLDFGSAVVEQEKREMAKPSPSSTLQKNRTILAKLNNMVGTFGKTLAAYQLFFTFSQLTSRICHAHQEVFEVLKTIIARLVVAFPHQALWLLMAVSKSSNSNRANRSQEIFATVRELKPELQKMIQDYTKLTERLLELCEKDIPSGKLITISQYFRSLKRLFEDSSFSEILVPLQCLMTVNLPLCSDTSMEHDPFPANLVYIRGFDDNVEILSSLQKPKKITLKGSDGGNYVMMCKPKDDLRKDCRLMEFNGIVNKFLRKDPESRKRYLYIRTYTVVPLNEECGLLEWVPNTRGLRHILDTLYKERGNRMTHTEIRAAMPTLQASKEEKLKAFKTKLLPRHPPVFGEWFLRTFTDPTSWYNARLAYCKTVAVMSMVGYILGLGDRHGENILFDSTSGDCVHVDFNCLFNRGETFEWPEKVPFRLTHNLIHAMGPLRLEGIYRRTCEVTLRVMRKESEPLMSVLKPFIYDPLVEWSKPVRGQRQAPIQSTGEITNEQARTHVHSIEERLQGIMSKGTKRSGLALSVEGQVNHLIQEATDENNLAQMFIGWAAYM